MKEDITSVALDDSKHSIVLGILRPQATEPELRQLPNEPRHLRRFFTRLQREGPMTSCYEAGPAGYDLYRQLTALGVPCQVMAPALTPRKPGERVKTNRRDAAKLVRLFRARELTPIRVPDEAQEAVRDLLRCREDLQEDLLRWRHRLLKFLARHGRGSRDGRHWTQRHGTWLRSQRFTDPVLARTGQEYRFTVEQLLARAAELEREVLALAETAPLPGAGGLAPLLPRDRYPRGDDPAGRDRRLPALPPPAGAHGLPGPRPERGLDRRPGPAREHHPGRQHPCAPDPGGGGLARPAPAAPGAGVGPAEPRPTASGPRPGVASAAAAPPAGPGIWWDMGNGPRWPWWRSPGNSSGSSGPP